MKSSPRSALSCSSCAACALLLTFLAAERGGFFVAPPGPLYVDPSELRVVDGDTFHFGPRELRLMGVDTPEKSAPWFDGNQEPWATRATRFSRRALERAREVEVRSRGRTDRYGRELVHVIVDGRPLAALLAQEGLAYPTVQHYGDGGFPEIAETILKLAQPPEFEHPAAWRATHRQPWDEDAR
ncbi:MAG: thermonuclease family protein [Planctomycetes bacterium]|nr:thermonuclease family protein [Planctomycetota bacterium]